MPWKKSTAKKPAARPATREYTPPPIVKRVHRITNGSPQQEAIWKLMAESDENLTVSALAGTGKTSSSVEGLHRTDRKGKRIGAVAYNKPIADDMAAKMPEGVEACTMHSMGNAACRNGLGAKMNKYKLDDTLREVITGDSQGDLDWPQVELKKVCESLVSLAKNTLVGADLDSMDIGAHLAPTNEALAGIIDHFGIEVPAKVSESEVFEVTREALTKSYQNTDEIDFDDMIWMPVVHGLTPSQKFDLLIVDEAQDLNRCRQQLCLQSAKRLMIVGDPNQAIYGFTGSDTESMDTMGRALEGMGNGHSVLPLTVTRRCPKSHVAMAQRIVPEFTAMDDAVEGVIGDLDFKALLTEAQPGDLMICRMNAPVCQAAFRLLAARKKVRIQGRDIGQGIISVVKKSRKDTTLELLHWLGDWRDKEEDRLRKRKRGFETAVEGLNDRYQCIIAFAGGCDTVAEMIQVIDRTFADGPGAEDFITLSSVHRAKGLEADRVMVLCPEILPAPWAKKDWERVQEKNLEYVAKTRSKREMYFVPDWRKDKVDTRASSIIE